MPHLPHPPTTTSHAPSTSSLPPRRLVAWLVAAVALLALAVLLDPWAFRTLQAPDIYEKDFGRMLRVMGFLPLWAIVAAALIAHDWPARARGALYPAIWRGALLLGSATAGGLAAEVLKLLFRRERPGPHAGEYVFRPFSERPFHSGGLGLPSSHTLVAFGAAAMLARLFPRSAPLWYLLAAGSGLSRVLSGAHFLSDVVVAALVGTLIAALLWRWHLRRVARSA